MFKIGDKVRVLVDGANCAGVKKGDVFTVDRVFRDGWVATLEGFRWFFSPDSIERVEEVDQITLNGKTWILTRHVDMPTITIDGIVYDMAEA